MERVLEIGYTLKTTFWQDFTIADAFGTEAIKDTFNRAFRDWKENVEYVTELTMVLNWKIWQHYENNNHEFSVLYDELWRESDEWCMVNLKGEDLTYYIKTTD